MLPSQAFIGAKVSLNSVYDLDRYAGLSIGDFGNISSRSSKGAVVYFNDRRMWCTYEQLDLYNDQSGLFDVVYING